jgi:branched-chain amino acid transport system permease protein
MTGIRLPRIDLPRRVAFPLAGVGLVVLLVVPQLLSTFWVSNLVQILVFGLFALSVSFLVGHTGMLPLGQAAFFAAGAYGAAWLQVIAGRGAIVSALGGVGLALLTSLVFSFAVRTQGVYFLLLTLAQGMIVWGVANRWTSVTRGENGIGGVALPTVGGVPLGRMDVYYYLVLVVVLVIVAGYFVLIHSPFGLTMRGIRDSESRMRALGYNVVLHKFVAFVLAGTMAGVAGVLYVYWNNFVSPPTAALLRSAEAKLAAIIGGPTTIIGAWFGAAVIILIRNYLSITLARYMTVMGLVFVLAALFFPGGLLGRTPRPTLRGAPRGPRQADATVPPDDPHPPPTGSGRAVETAADAPEGRR